MDLSKLKGMDVSSLSVGRFKPDMSRVTGVDEMPYNQGSGCITLKGPDDKTMVAFYAGGKEYPQSGEERFTTVYREDFTALPDDLPVPSEAPADVEAICFPAKNLSDTHLPPESAQPTGIEDPADGATKETITPRAQRKGSMGQAGMSIGENGIDFTSGGKASVSVSGGTIRAKADSFEQPTTEKKGLTKETPLTGLIPKTIITFFVSDFLPSISFIMKLRNYVRIIMRMPTLYSALKKIHEYDGKNTDEWPDTGRADIVGRGANDEFNVSGWLGVDDNEYEGRDTPREL